MKPMFKGLDTETQLLVGISKADSKTLGKLVI
jgi:hypothetical protein